MDNAIPFTSSSSSSSSLSLTVSSPTITSSSLTTSISSPPIAPEPDSLTSPTTLWNSVSTSARAILTSVENGIRDFLTSSDVRPFPSPSTLSPTTIVYLLGKQYSLDSNGFNQFISDFARRPRLTYRFGFPPISPTKLTSDSGWGCMIRVGQSLLLESFLRAQFGREHSLTSDPAYLKVLEMFRDDPAAPFSIHALAHRGQELDTAIGQWFGPTVLAQSVKYIAQDSQQPLIPVVVVAQDATVFIPDVKEAWNKRVNSSLLLLAPLRLGLDTLHPTYWPFIQECLKSPFSVGIAGGRPSAALYMVGSMDDTLLVLDPHYVQTALLATSADVYTCATSTVKCIPSTSVDPSLCFGFLFNNLNQLDQWVEWITETSTKGIQVPLCIQDMTASSSWDELPDESFTGEEGEDGF